MKKRNTGIDLLRLVSMALVVLHHILTHGGLGLAATQTDAHGVVCALEALSACAVDVFALISGYVSSGATKRSLSRGVLLWLSVAFWSVLLTAISLGAGALQLSALKRAAMPVTSQQYWFFTSYFPLLFLAPALERLLDALNHAERILLTGACFLLFCLLPAYAGTDLFGTGNGYYTLWLAALYLVGGTLQRAPSRRQRSLLPPPTILGAMLIITAVLKFRGDAPGQVFSAPLRYTSPTVFLSAVVLVCLFARLSLPERAEAPLTRLSRAAFGVYLIHDHPAVRARFFTGRFAEWASRPLFALPSGLVPSVLGLVLAVMALCLALESLRILLFSALHLPQLFSWMASKLFKAWQRLLCREQA